MISAVALIDSVAFTVSVVSCAADRQAQLEDQGLSWSALALTVTIHVP